MKKGNFILLAIILIAAIIIVSQNIKCSGGGNENVTVTKVTVKGDELPSPVVDSAGEISSYDIQRLQAERDMYFHKYQSERQRSATLALDISQLDSSILATTDCKEALRLSQIQIARLREQFERDTALISALFADFDKQGEMREYSGTVTGKHFETSWRAKVFGVLPSDGMLLKTDVFYDSTTVVKFADRWKKNTVEAFGALNLDADYSVGIGYERRGKTLGVFAQSDYTPHSKKTTTRGGLRIHF